METNPELQKKANPGQIAIKGAITKPEKTGSAKEPEVRMPKPPVPERAG